MSRASHTPIPFWMDMPISKFFRWIDSANELNKEDEREMERLKGKK